MTKKNRVESVGNARAALIVAAQRRSILTYGELGDAIGIDGVGLRNELHYVLDELSEDCNAAGEPSLAALVVNADTGMPGKGWSDGTLPWHTEVRRVHQAWSPR